MSFGTRCAEVELITVLPLQVERLHWCIMFMHINVLVPLLWIYVTVAVVEGL